MIPEKRTFGPGSAVLRKPQPLTVQEDLFCREYIVDFSCTQAAIRANYSEKSADTYGSEMLKRPKIRARVSELLAERRTEYEVSEERLKREIARIAFSDITELIDVLLSGRNQVTMKSLADIPKKYRAAIRSFENTKYGVKVTFHDKMQALDMLNKHLGLYEKDNSQKQRAGVAIYLPDNGRKDSTIDTDQFEVIEAITPFE